MAKKYLPLLAFGLISVQLHAQTSNSSPYCMPVFGTSNPTALIGIGNVQYGTTSNPTTRSNNTYTFYNNVAPVQATGGSYTSLNINFGGSPTGSTTNPYLAVYMDWNQDHSFDGMTETFDATNGYGNAGTVAVGGNAPDTAVYGTTRVRVMWVSAPGPCPSQSGTSFYGEAEDYPVNVTGVKPIPRVTSAANLGSHTATLQGTMYANGPAAATVDFEYGQTTAYTNSVTGGSVSANAHTPVSANITGLAPNTIYHYRVKGTNSAGSSYSADKTFVTTSGVGVGSVNNVLTNLTISPNPVKGELHINGLSIKNRYTAILCDVNGRQLFSSAVSQDGRVNVEQLSRGMYFLKIINADDYTESAALKIVVE